MTLFFSALEKSS